MKANRAIRAIAAALACGMAARALPAETASETESDEYKLLGGTLRRPGTHKGRIVYANCQKRLPEAALRGNAAAMEREVLYVVEVEPGTFDLARPKIVGDATLFVVDDPALPTLLSAPEDRWCVVNVARLAADGADEARFRDRAGKELSRGFALLGGAFQSQFQQTLTECVTEPKQLDKYTGDRLPFDALRAIETYLKGYGLKPYEPISYREACYEGWAPAPKDDVQKAIRADVAAELARDKAAGK